MRDNFVADPENRERLAIFNDALQCRPQQPNPSISSLTTNLVQKGSAAY
jgi:hypothetical protein